MRGLQAELKQNVPFRSREQEAYLALLRTADALQTSVEAKLGEFSLTGTQYNALRILRGAGPEGLPCSEIGERMITRDPDVTRLLNRLEKRGLVRRTRAQSDRRVVRGKITAAGMKLLRAMDEPVAKHGRDILKHVGQQKLQQLIELLELVRTGNARTGNLRTGNVRTGNVANRRAAQ
jgi:MarR family transcriptional regulator, organic hydroperoxide resistance regulator